MSKKRLRDIRITLPKGLYYDVLLAGAKLHGAPSISKYVLNAAMTYTQQYIEEKKNELDKRKEEGLLLRDTSGNTAGEDAIDERSDNRDGSGSGEVPSTSDV